MSAPNFTYAGTIGGSGVTPEVKTFSVASGTTSSILIGDIVVVTAGFAAKVANAGMAAAGKYGLAVSGSNETSTVAGTVDVQFTPVGLFVNGTFNGSVVQANLFTGFKIAVSGATQTVDLGNAGVATAWSFIAATPTKGQVVLPWAV